MGFGDIFSGMGKNFRQNFTQPSYSLPGQSYSPPGVGGGASGGGFGGYGGGFQDQFLNSPLMRGVLGGVAQQGQQDFQRQLMAQQGQQGLASQLVGQGLTRDRDAMQMMNLGWDQNYMQSQAMKNLALQRYMNPTALPTKLAAKYGFQSPSALNIDPRYQAAFDPTASGQSIADWAQRVGRYNPQIAGGWDAKAFGQNYGFDPEFSNWMNAKYQGGMEAGNTEAAKRAKMIQQAIDMGSKGASKGSGMLGGAASGASMGSMFGPWGAGIGAGIGALSGLFK